MVEDFPYIAFQSSLSTGAILFGVFGFLYSMFGFLFDVQDGPPVVQTIRMLCKTISAISVFNAVLTALSVYLIFSKGLADLNLVLAILLAAIVAFIAGISLWMAFWTMG